MTRPLFLMISFLTVGFTARSQGFNIAVDFYDSISPSGYEVHFNGHALFTDSMKVYYSVKTTDSIPELLMIDSVDFTVPSPVFPSGFTYTAVDSTLQIHFGNYSTKNLILELYSIIEGKTREHIHVNIPNFETYIENEE
jgi:hypothetical protein